MALTLSNLSIFQKIPCPNDFTFVVDNHKYHCPKVLAAFISPAVSRRIMSDIFCESFSVPLQDDKYQFKAIMKLMKGCDVEINTKNYQFILNAASILENHEIINKINELSIQKFNKRTIIDETLKKLEMNQNIDCEIGFIAEHVTKFSARSLSNFSIIILQKIFNSFQVKTKEESNLFHLIYDIIELKGPAARVLLNYVYYENLSIAEMIDFSELLGDDEMTGPIIMALIKRLKKQVKVHKKNPLRKVSNEESYDFQDGNSFNGIFAHLQNQWKKNVQDSKIIKIISSAGDSPKQLTDHTWTDCWYSKNEPNSWVRFDFQDHAVSLTHYSLKTFVGGPNSGHLKSWNIEGSNDLKNWVEIDKQDENNDLNNRNMYKTYKCHKNGGIFRYIRLMQTGKNHCGNDFLFLSNIELFGAFI